MKLPLIRNLAVAPARAPILRYGVALLSTLLALIPTLFFSDLAESRLVVFAVAVMVSAWYGGWKPGLAATSFALTVSAYYSLIGGQTPGEYRRAIAHLAFFFAVALLICWFNAALRATQESLRRSESNFRSLVMNAPYGICRCDVARRFFRMRIRRWWPCLVMNRSKLLADLTRGATSSAVSTPTLNNGFKPPIISMRGKNSTI